MEELNELELEIQDLKTELADAKNAREAVEKEVDELKNGGAEVKKTSKHNEEVESLKKKVELEKKLKKELEVARDLQQRLHSCDGEERERLQKLVEDKERLKELTRDERLAFNLGRLQQHIEKRAAESTPEPDRLAEKLKEIEEGEIEEIKKALEKEFQLRKRKALSKKRKGKFWPFGRKSKSETDQDIESCIEIELGNPKLPDCYEEIRTLLDVEKDGVRKKALATWQDKVTLLTKRVERKRNKIGDLKNEVYQLIGFFSVFQGVVLTAVSQSNQLYCNNLWSPTLLSVLASIVTVAGVIQKLNHIRDYQNTVHSEEGPLKKVVQRVSDLKSQGQKFRFSKYLDSRAQTRQSRSILLGYSGFVIISLGIFTLAFPISHWRILCHPGSCH